MWSGWFSEKPRYTIVIFLSAVAGITVLLLLVLTVVHIFKRQSEKRKFQVQMQEAEKDNPSPQPKTVTIEIQGSKEETREIHVSPGDIIIIDHNELNSAGSEDLGYLSEIVRYYNGHSTTASDDQSSFRKRSLTCGSPSVISTEMSESDKKPEVRAAEQPVANGDCVAHGNCVANGNCVRSPAVDITVNPLCASWKVPRSGQWQSEHSRRLRVCLLGKRRSWREENGSEKSPSNGRHAPSCLLELFPFLDACKTSE